jgi:hypothetical protein
VLPITASLSIGACGDDDAAKPTPTDPKAEVLAVHYQRLTDFLAEDAAAFVSHLDPSCRDIGGGSSGDGILSPEFFTAAYWQTFFAGPRFAPFRGQGIDDLIDRSTAQVWTKAEAEARISNWGSIFRMLEGDLLVNVHPRPSSPLDGWFGIYRKTSGRWLLVALD